MSDGRMTAKEEMERQRGYRSSVLRNLFLARRGREDLGGAVGLSEASGNPDVGAFNKYPVLRYLTMALGGGAAGAAVGGAAGHRLDIERRRLGVRDDQGLPLGALAGTAIGLLIGTGAAGISQKSASNRLRKEALEALSGMSKAEIAAGVREASKRDPSWWGMLVGQGPYHRGRARALQALKGDSPETPLGWGLDVANFVSSNVPYVGGALPAGVAAYDVHSAKKEFDKILGQEYPMNGVNRLFQVAGVRHVAAPLDPVTQKKAEELGVLATKIFGYAAPTVLYGTGGAALGSLAGLAVSKKGKRLRSMFKGAGIGGGIGAAGGLIQGARLHGKINQIVLKLEAERQKKNGSRGVGGKAP
jgi:hypothetical protein